MQPQARRKKFIDGFRPRPVFSRSDRLHELQGLPGSGGAVPQPHAQHPPRRAQAPVAPTPPSAAVHAPARPHAPATRPHAAAKPNPTPTPQQPAPERRSFQAPNPPKRVHFLLRALLFPAAILFCLFASFLVQSQPLGIGALVIYGVVAWFKRLPSSYSFVMAVMSLGTVIILLLTRPTIDLATNFSTYTFLLFVIGIISAVRESQSYPKRRNSKIPHLLRKKRSW